MKEILFIISAFLFVVPLIKCDYCAHDLSSPNFFSRYVDFSFLGKFFKNMFPFTHPKNKMLFYLYKRDFPNCGKEIRTNDDESLSVSGFNSSHQTRIIIHGWMSQSKGKFNRAVTKAYLSLAGTDDNIGDFNVIVTDWSFLASNANYFGVVKFIDDLGAQIAEFAKFLQIESGAHFDDIYLIGHSLGAQIAGCAGKHLKPFKFNTIFALDPAAIEFRHKSNEYRIDPSDANYVESIQTSTNLGFEEPMGNATFYPNYGTHQKCYTYGCSHKRSYVYFAESITSKKGFWGSQCERKSEDDWLCSMCGDEFQMGGEPSTPKQGLFYLKTAANKPYALGKRKSDD